MSEFKSAEKAEGDVLHLEFHGMIDEDVAFPAVDPTKYKKVAIDLKGIKTINSVGIREWLNWIRPIADKSEIELQQCPKAMVFQFNMVEGFLPPRAVVSSFFVPFFSEATDKEYNVLFTIGKEVTLSNGNVALNFDPTSVDPGGSDMEMDVTEAKYFQFLKRSQANG